MSSYISADTKSAISSIMDNIHDTFSQEIMVYKDAKKNIVAMSPSYNSIYGSGGSTPTTETNETVSRAVQARIKYYSHEEEYFEDSKVDSQIKVKVPQGSIRIKVAKEDYLFIKEAKRIDFDGNRYNITDIAKPIGPFSPRYYSFILTLVDESSSS